MHSVNEPLHSRCRLKEGQNKAPLTVDLRACVISSFRYLNRAVSYGFSLIIIQKVDIVGI